MSRHEPGDLAASLADVPRGASARVMAIDGERTELLARHGLRVGSVVTVESVVPLGGPRVVVVGRARLALARELARDVRVRPATLDQPASAR